MFEKMSVINDNDSSSSTIVKADNKEIIEDKVNIQFSFCH